MTLQSCGAAPANRRESLAEARANVSVQCSGPAPQTKRFQ